VSIWRSTSTRAFLTQGLSVLAIGLFVALWRSFSLLDPFFLIAFLSCAAILVGPIVVKGYDYYNDCLALLRHGVIRACGATVVAFFIALVWINVQWKGDLLLPDGPVFISALLLSVAFTTCTAILLLLARERFDAKSAIWMFRGAVAVVVLVYRFFPQSWSAASAEFLIEHGPAQVVFGLALMVTSIDVVLLLAASHRWQREV
jgi:hypothetical protein